MENHLVQLIKVILFPALSLKRKFNNTKLLRIFIFTCCMLILSCNFRPNSFDIDIRSASKLKPRKGSRQFIQSGKTESGIGFIISNDYLTDTAYFYEQDKITFFFFREKNEEGVSGGDIFIFTKDSFVYKVLVSHELAPDSKNYVSVFKFTEKGCINYEGKAFYQWFSSFELIRKINIFDLLSSMNGIDSNFFIHPKNDYRLSSYL